MASTNFSNHRLDNYVSINTCEPAWSNQWLFILPIVFCVLLLALLPRISLAETASSVIYNAPSLRLPALAAHKTTAQQLGYRNTADLLTQSLQSTREVELNAIAFSPDGKILASGSKDNTIKLWDVASGKLLSKLKWHKYGYGVRSVAFDDKGHLASGSWDNTVKVWDVTSGKLLNTLKGHKNSVRSVAFDGKGHLASGSGDKTVKLWDVTSGKLLNTFKGHERVVTSVAFNGKGHLASGSGDKTVKLWDVASGKLLNTLKGHERGVTSVAFDDKGHLASGSSDYTIKLWDIASGKLLSTLGGHKSFVSSVAFDGKGHLASGSSDNTIKLWDVTSGKLLSTLKGHKFWVNSVAFDGKGHLASGSSDYTIKLWDVASGKRLGTFKEHERSVLSVAFDGKGYLASGSWDNTVKLWDVASGKLLSTLKGHNGIVTSVAFDGKGHLASGSYDSTVKLWDVTSGKLLSTLKGHERGVTSVAFDDKGHLASGSYNTIVKLWDVASGKLLSTLKGNYSGVITSLAFDDKGHLAISSDDGVINLWDIVNNKLLNTPKKHGNNVSSVAFDGKGHLASGSWDETVKLWDVASGNLLSTLKWHQGGVTSVAFDNSGHLAASGSSNNTIKLWDVASGKLLSTLKEHEGRVTSVAFDGKGHLASGSADGTVKLWDIAKDENIELKIRLNVTLFASDTGGWASVFENGDVLRADKGDLLRIAQPWGDGIKWQYLPPVKTPVVTMQLQEFGIINGMELKASTHFQLAADQSQWFYVKLHNPDKKYPIQRPRIIIPHQQRGVVKILPAESIMSYPQAVAYYSKGSIIPAGESLILAARLIQSSDQPVASGALAKPFPIVIDSDNGGRQQFEFNIELKTPDVQVLNSEYSIENNTLSVTLKNQGTVALQETLFYLSDGKNKLENIPTQTLDSIAPQAERSIAFSVDSDQWDVDNTQLRILPLSNPIYNNWTVKLAINTSFIPYYLAALSLLLLAFTVFYFRRYRHPLILSLGEMPTALLHLPLEQLAEAKQRLSQTQRLTQVLSTAEVSPQSLERAIDFMEMQGEEKIALLKQRLGALIPPNPPFSKGEIHILSLSNSFPLNINRLQFFFPDTELAVEDVFNRLKNIPQAQNHFTVIIGKDSAYQRKLYTKTSDSSNKWVAPLSHELTHLLLSQDTETALAEILAGQLSLQQISPYRIGGGVANESLFFGRKEMLSQIINRDPANYLIVGGRQVGKSTLLKALERRYADNTQVQCHYLSLSSEVLVPRLAAVLQLEKSADPEHFASGLEAVIQQTGQRYVFLIDEADKFIEHEQQQGYPILQVFRRLTEQGNCSFILAGFWQLYQHVVLDYQSPLRNFGELIQVGALEHDACLQLASVPMLSMRLEYANTAIVEQLVTECGQRANLISKSCQDLVTQLSRQQRIIEAGDMHRALHSDVIRKEITGWSVGHNDKEQHYDRLVVYATILLDDFSTGELIQSLKDKGVKLDIAELERCLSRLEMAFVIGRNTGRWSYRVPLFVEYMQEESPELKLAAEVARGND